jgi:hypothetical protein
VDVEVNDREVKKVWSTAGATPDAAGALGETRVREMLPTPAPRKMWDDLDGAEGFPNDHDLQPFLKTNFIPAARNLERSGGLRTQ